MAERPKDFTPDEALNHSIRVLQSKAETFVKACGGSVPLRAFRMYIETQERDDAIISRAMVDPSGPCHLARTREGVPVVSLAEPAAQSA